MKPIDSIRKLVRLQNSYSRIARATVSKDREELLIKRLGELGDRLEVSDPMLRETLREHVGHVPIIAAFLHPHIEHSQKVDLGRALVMLSVHDIGELTTGDVFEYAKREQDICVESEAAQRMLHPDHKSIYNEFVNCNSYDARFAKAVDVLAPILNDIDKFDIAHARFEKYRLSSEEIYRKQIKYFEWDSFLLEMFEELSKLNEKIERGEHFLMP